MGREPRDVTIVLLCEREILAFPQPPWTQAPSEVMAWGATTGGRRGPVMGPHRATHVKGFEVELPAAQESRLLARLARLGLGQLRDGRVHIPHLITRLAHRAPPEIFAGRFGGARVEVRLRKGAHIEVRVGFVPPLVFRKASRFIGQLGLPESEGSWL